MANRLPGSKRTTAGRTKCLHRLASLTKFILACSYVGFAAMMSRNLIHAIWSCSCRRFALPAVAALALWGGWASRAEATCGDYLMVGHSRLPMSAMPGHSLPGDSSAPVESQTPQPGPCPCDGPECSSGNGPAATVPASVRVSHDPTWAWLERQDRAAPFPPTALVAGLDLLSLQRTSSRLFRPPR
jgi:hypothetical protein